MEARTVTSTESVNQVRLVGRVSQEAQERVLPSGDSLWTFRIVVPRPGPTRSGRASVDALDCAVWGGRARRSVPSWRPGDTVEVLGAMRRRFFRQAGGPTSRVEVEVAEARLIRRASSA
jgi:single-strand DNA-binding protein